MPGPSIAFIIGAGASVCAGAPILSNLYARANRLNDRRQLDEYQKDFEALREAKFQISRARSIPIDDENLEQVLDALEMTQLIGGFPDIKPDEAREMSTSTKRLLARVIETSIVFGTKTDSKGNKYLVPPKPYQDLAHKIHGSRSSKNEVHCNIITFNYDTLIELALVELGVPYDYCLSKTRKHSLPVKLCKLHGSLSWKLNSSGCVEAADLANCDLQHWEDAQIDASGVRLHHDRLFSKDSVPYIVPPLSNKLVYHQPLASVWREAAKAISDAAVIIVIGYSLPPTDHFFKQFLGLSTVSRNSFEKLYCFDPSLETAKRYQELLGEHARSRFVHVPLCFENEQVMAKISNIIDDLSR